jgi:hypothetical protein
VPLDKLGLALRQRQDDAVGDRKPFRAPQGIYLVDQVVDAALEQQLVVECELERDRDPVR